MATGSSPRPFLDRVLHHAITISIRGNSFRLKDKLEVGLVKPVEATTSTGGWGNFDDPEWRELGDP